MCCGDFRICGLDTNVGIDFIIIAMEMALGMGSWTGILSAGTD